MAADSVETVSDKVIPGKRPSWEEILGALRVLRRDQYDALLKAETIINEANHFRAEKEREAKANKQAAEIAEIAARKQAVAEGIEQGRNDGLQLVQSVSRRWDNIADLFENKLDEMLKKYLVVYAGLLAERVLRERLSDPSEFEKYVRRTLDEEEKGRKCLGLSVSPQDAASLRALKKEIPALSEAEIGEDRTLAPGDLRLQFKGYLVDARVETMLATGVSILLEEILKTSVPKPEAAK